MAGDGEDGVEVAMKKSGVELFREILRVMDDSDVEDYYKAGVWKDELMRLDLQLVYAHRKEGGAPEPRPLADVPAPKLPGGASGIQLGAGGLAGALAARVAALKSAAGGGGAIAASGRDVAAVKKPVEPNDGPDWLQVALKKTGAELFRELLRVMGDADEEDYSKSGAWLDDLMRLDLKLVDAHRKEGGAPSVPALKDVREPKLPGSATGGMQLGALGATVSGSALAARVAALKAAAVRGGVIGGLAGPAAALQQFVPIGTVAAGTVNTATASSVTVGAAGAPAAEVRLITLFATKWKLDPARTKLILAQLSPPRRRYVIQKFQTTDVGAAAMEHLETYITECELTNAWEAAEKLSASKPLLTSGVQARPANVAPVHLGAGVSFKRPLMSAALDAAKRPRLNLASPQATGALNTSAIAQRLAAARAKIASGGAPQTAGAFAGAKVTPFLRPGGIAPAGQHQAAFAALALRKQQLAAGGVGGLRPPQNNTANQNAANGNLIRNLLTRV